MAYFFFFLAGGRWRAGGGGWTKGGKEALQDVKEKEKAEGDGNREGRTAVHPQRGEALRVAVGPPVTGNAAFRSGAATLGSLSSRRCPPSFPHTETIK